MCGWNAVYVNHLTPPNNKKNIINWMLFKCASFSFFSCNVLRNVAHIEWNDIELNRKINSITILTVLWNRLNDIHRWLYTELCSNTNPWETLTHIDTQIIHNNFYVEQKKIGWQSFAFYLPVALCVACYIYISSNWFGYRWSKSFDR